MKTTYLILKSLNENDGLRSILDRIDLNQRENLITISGRFKCQTDKQKLLDEIVKYPNFKILCDAVVEEDMSVSENDLLLKHTISQTLASGLRYYNHIVVKVSAGRVYLDGKVKCENDRKLVFSLVEQILGVKSIFNNLTFSRIDKLTQMA